MRGNLVARYLAPIVRYAGYVLGNGAHAEDVAQETLLRLMAKSPNWRPGGPTVRAWLTRVAANLCMDHGRRGRLEPLDAAADLADPRDHNALETDLDMVRSVRAALGCLPERQLAALALIESSDAARAAYREVARLDELLDRMPEPEMPPALAERMVALHLPRVGLIDRLAGARTSAPLIVWQGAVAATAIMGIAVGMTLSALVLDPRHWTVRRSPSRRAEVRSSDIFYGEGGKAGSPEIAVLGLTGDGDGDGAREILETPVT